jgi:hypothetical protein
LGELRGQSGVSQLSHPNLHVTRIPGALKPRRICKIVGASPVSELGVWNGDVGTLEKALLERMYYCKVDGEFLAPPSTDIRVVNKILLRFKTLVLKNLGVTTPMSLPEVVETYRGRKRQIYEAALENLSGGVQRHHAHAITFVKLEKGNPTKAPRCIQPRRPEYNLCVGRYIKKLEHRVYRAIAKVWGDGPTVMKGYNVTQVAGIMHGKWKSFKQPVAVGLDAMKFDMHVSEAMLLWEHSVYLRCFSDTDELRRLLKWQIDNVGKGYCDDGKLRYKVRGRRFSGDMNTALGNCLIMCAMVWEYCREKGVGAKLVNNGDDCQIFMERDDLDRFMFGLSEWFLRLGFRMTVEQPVYVFEQVEFCQMRPIYNGVDYVMVRNLRTALAKDTMSTVDLVNQVVLEKWLTAVGEGGINLTSGIPILQEFYQCYLRNGNGRKSGVGNSMGFQTGLRLLSVGMHGEYRSCTPEARLSAYLAWGITPDEQVALEQYYAGLSISWNEPSDIDQPNSFVPLALDELSISW